MPKLKLTQRDISKLPWLSARFTNQQIAVKLGISVRWVKERLKRLRRLGVKLPYRIGRPKKPML